MAGIHPGFLDLSVAFSTINHGSIWSILGLGWKRLSSVFNVGSSQCWYGGEGSGSRLLAPEFCCFPTPIKHLHETSMSVGMSAPGCPSDAVRILSWVLEVVDGEGQERLCFRHSQSWVLFPPPLDSGWDGIPPRQSWYTILGLSWTHGSYLKKR